MFFYDNGIKLLQRIFQIITQSKEFITFVILSVISLTLITTGNVSKIGGFRTIIIASTGWFQDAFSWIPNPGALKSENRALRDLNLQLSDEVTRMRKALIENEKLRTMIDLKQKSDYELLSAEIVGKSTIQLRNYITLNKGSDDNIKRGMSVRTDAGLIGSIIAVSDNYSVVELISNRNVRVSVKIERTQLDGILHWEGGESYKVRNIPKTLDVQVGDILITSNYSNRFPANIPIGQIIEVSEEQGTLFYRLIMKPFASFETMEQVFIIKQLPDGERLDLIRQIEEKLSGKN